MPMQAPMWIFGRNPQHGGRRLDAARSVRIAQCKTVTMKISPSISSTTHNRSLLDMIMMDLSMTMRVFHLAGSCILMHRQAHAFSSDFAPGGPGFRGDRPGPSLHSHATRPDRRKPRVDARPGPGPPSQEAGPPGDSECCPRHPSHPVPSAGGQQSVRLAIGRALLAAGPGRLQRSH